VHGGSMDCLTCIECWLSVVDPPRNVAVHSHQDQTKHWWLCNIQCSVNHTVNVSYIMWRDAYRGACLFKCSQTLLTSDQSGVTLTMSAKCSQLVALDKLWRASSTVLGIGITYTKKYTFNNFQRMYTCRQCR